MTDHVNPVQSSLLRDAGQLLISGNTTSISVSKFVVQIWSTLNGRWMDSAFNMVDTLPEALSLAEQEQPSERWPRVRVVHRTVAIFEREAPVGAQSAMNEVDTL